MTWTLLVLLILASGIGLLASLQRRAELVRMQSTLQTRVRAEERGSAAPKLMQPVIDLSRCLGCGTCVDVCPEEGVLGMLHGQASILHGSRCEGIGACERECPVGAIQVTIADLDQRDDVPAIEADFEAVGTPGLFLAGEVTAHALIKTAVEHGKAVGSEVARRTRSNKAKAPAELDLCIVGAGPAGLACSLEAKRQGLDFLTLDSELSPGGTVAKYPRRKLVMTQPVDMPLYGRLEATTYTKEELIDLWSHMVTEKQLPFRGGEELRQVVRQEDGVFTVHTSQGNYRARHVCLALGRRGTPTKLGVPGEELPKVAYSLLDAESYAGLAILVVGGGDSAVEAALALAAQPGNRVTLAYRGSEFHRLRARNERRLDVARSAQSLQIFCDTDLVSIQPDSVALSRRTAAGRETLRLGNQAVFIMAGGTPPFELLQQAGVSFDPALRPQTEVIAERGSGLVPALSAALGLSVAALGFGLWHFDYYRLSTVLRPEHIKFDQLRPGRHTGLALGVTACALILINLLYLARKSPRFPLQFGSLKHWMTSHVATGVLALLCVLLHAGFVVRDTVGGHALWALTGLLVTGAIGRYFYAWVPRAANGRELELEEIRSTLGALGGDAVDRAGVFHARVREHVARHRTDPKWGQGFLRRVVALFTGGRRLRRSLREMRALGREEGVPAAEISAALDLARRAHRSGVMAAHFEDLRALLASWRYLHRWAALLMVLLVLVHVAYALFYGSSQLGGV